MSHRTVALTVRAGAAALLLVLLTACGGSGSTGHNQADVRFAQEMIPHHQQAVAMSRLVEGRDAGPGVEDLARRIEQAQGPEIATMKGWLSSWGEESGASMSGSMPGMLSGADLEKLAAAKGGTFARLYLREMVAHHTGAIAMARTEQDKGENAAARDLAKRIEKAQTSEIKEIRQLLAGG